MERVPRTPPQDIATAGIRADLAEAARTSLVVQARTAEGRCIETPGLAFCGPAVLAPWMGRILERTR